MKTYIAFLYGIVLLFVSCGTTSREEVAYLIPEGFQGTVMVIFDQEDGAAKEYDDKRRIYRIGIDGILKTQFEFANRTAHTRFYYVNTMDQRKELQYYSPMDLRDKKTDQETIICYNRENGVTNDKKTKKEIRFEILLVSSIKNLDSIANKRSSIMWEELNK